MEHPDTPSGPERPPLPRPEETGGDTRFVRRWRGGTLGRLVLIDTADLDEDGEAEIIALAGRDLKVFDWNGDTYLLRWEASLPREGLSLAAGPLTDAGPAAVAVGTRDSVLLYTTTSAMGLQLLCQTLNFPNAYFRSLDLTDLGGDGRAEVVAAASGAQTMYVFGVLAAGGEARLEELGRIYIGGVAAARGARGGDVATGNKEGFVDVFVPCSLLPSPTQAIYCVRRGDSLWAVARRFGVSPAAVARANRLHEPYQLEPGQVLVIPPPARGARGPSGGEGRSTPAP